jgi:hypothetical protein
MARKKKDKSQPAAQQPAAADAGHNKMTDEDLQRLTIQHRDAYKVALAAKKAADAKIKNVCKQAKAELGKFAVDQIKIMIELETDEGELEVANKIERMLQAARWMGAKIGQQFNLFPQDGGIDPIFEEGKRSGMAGDPARVPVDFINSADASSRYMKGWHAGQEVKARGFARGDKATDATKGDDYLEGMGERVSREDFKKNLQDITRTDGNGGPAQREPTEAA